MAVATETKERILDGLNDRQQSAVTHGVSPLLVIAGAGTGKTTTLSRRVAWLIAEGIDPGRILLLTFSRRAAAEMLRRVERIHRDIDGQAGPRPAGRRIWGGTFHSIGTRLLRRFGYSIGLETDFTILDRSDAEDLMAVCRSELDLEQSESRFPLKGTCLSIYSRCINTQQRLLPLLKRWYPWCEEHEESLKRLFDQYIDRKEEQAVLDYDDLLLFWEAMTADEQAGPLLRDRFDCVLVDEYQDTNLLQASILQNLRPDGEGLTVVGDDAQSIYSFRAATVRNILDFPTQYPGTTVVKLEQNYRSTQPILEATNRLIAASSERHEKTLWSDRPSSERPLLIDCVDENDQSQYVIDRVLERREQGTPLRQQAVLFRASHHSLALEVELGRRNVPYHKYGGLKFIETAHIKDVLSFLRLAENPRDLVAGLRVLMLLPGIGQKTATALLRRLGKTPDFAVWKKHSPPPAARLHWPLFVALMRTLTGAGAATPELPAQIDAVRKFYAPLLERKHDNAPPRLRDVEQLAHVAARFEDRRTFLAEVTLDPPTSTQDLAQDPKLDEDYLVLSTIHSAKGLEWDAVFLLHAADGNIPSDMATGTSEEIEEERRLLYVALTRAQNALTVCFTQRYYFGGRTKSDSYGHAQLTRFLPADVLKSFERKTAFPAEPDSDSASEKSRRVRQRSRRMWT